MNWIDLHSHNPKPEPAVTKIYSLSASDIRNKTNLDMPFVVGVHPWWIGKDTTPTLQNVAELLEHPNCWGLGEVGLDRAINTNFDEQKKVFEDALRLAQDKSLARVVLHCVRSYSDILETLKKVSYEGTLIFHDYNGNLETTQQLLKHKAYFSIGPKVLDPNTTIAKTISQIPLESVFLETDDQDQTDIFALHEGVAKILKMSVEALKNQIYKNFKSIGKI